MRKFLIFIYFIFAYTIAYGDSLEDFHKRLDKYSKAADNKFQNAGDTASMVEAYTDYYKILDKELNSVYKLLMNNLAGNKEAMSSLKASQLKWIEYRDKEFIFINVAYNSGGTNDFIYRSSSYPKIVIQRIEELLSIEIGMESDG